MRFGGLAASLAIAWLWSETSAIAKPKLIEFDPPHSVETVVLSDSPNIRGTVVGLYETADDQRAFLRKRNGKIVDIGQTLFSPNPIALNDRNTTAGNDAHGHGFAIEEDGTAISFDVPGANGSGYGTRPRTIDSKGNIAGYYSNPLQYNLHGFLRSARGRFTKFDAPHAGRGSDQGTYVLGLDSKFGATGYAIDDNDARHGFLRAPDGTFTAIDIDGAGTGPLQGTIVASINSVGSVAGTFITSDNVSHGFLRNADGDITVIDVGDAGNGSGQGTVVLGINTNSDAAGYFFDSSGAEHGFVCSASGKITVIDAPDAVLGAGVGTEVRNVNDKGEIAGYYTGADQTYHGFFGTL